MPPIRHYEIGEKDGCGVTKHEHWKQCLPSENRGHRNSERRRDGNRYCVPSRATQRGKNRSPRQRPCRTRWKRTVLSADSYALYVRSRSTTGTPEPEDVSELARCCGYAWRLPKNRVHPYRSSE